MLNNIMKVLGNISGWFSPERADRRRRKKIKRYEDEVHDLFEKENSDTNRNRIMDCLRELKQLRSDFTA